MWLWIKLELIRRIVWFLFPLRRELRQMHKETMMKLSEAIALLTSVDAQMEKAKTEILQKIADLEASLADVELPPEAQAIVNDLRVKAQALDDIVPDAP